MPPENLISIVYDGSLPAVEIRDGQQRNYVFNHGKPLKVPEKFANRLLIKPGSGFKRPEDLLRPISSMCAGGPVIFRRWGALGDLLMFRVACAALKRVRPDLEIILKCQQGYAALFEHDPLWAKVWPIGETPTGHWFKEAVAKAMEFNFDRTAEADHSERGDVDRIRLFLERMMDPSLIEIKAADWQIPLPPHVTAYIDRWLESNGLKNQKRPLIALQVRGSGPQKTIPTPQLQRVASELSKRANVVLIENSDEFTWSAPGIYTMTGRDALHAIGLLQRCALAVTADSGALWLAHAALCPVLIFMGPRPAATRTNRHPLGPVGARAIQLNDLVVLNGKQGCPPCLEKADACSKRFSCIREQPDDVLISSIAKGVDEMLSDKALAKAVKASRKL